MLYLGYLGEAKKIDIKDDALKLLIVRRPPKVIPKGFIHTPHLSPSVDLFKATQRWKKGDFTPKEQHWLKKQNIEIDENAWWELYRVKFNYELENRPDMKKALNRVEELLREGKDIFLFCFCKDTNKCHRLLVGKHIERKGYEVNYRNDKKGDKEE